MFFVYFLCSDYANKIVLPWRYVLSFQCFSFSEILRENLSEIHREKADLSEIHIGKKQRYFAWIKKEKKIWSWHYGHLQWFHVWNVPFQNYYIWQTNKNSIYLAVINKRTRLKGAWNQRVCPMNCTLLWQKCKHRKDNRFEGHRLWFLLLTTQR